MPRITEKEVEHIANLARIKISRPEKEKLTKELGAILDYVGQLDELNLEGVEPTAQVTGLENVFRKDGEPLEASAENTEKLIGLAPHKKDNFVKVKSILDAK